MTETVAVPINGAYKLSVKLIGAVLTRDTDMIGKMEPYPVITFCPLGVERPFKFKGSPQKGSDKEPVWNWEVSHLFGSDSSASANKATI
jgi:hypothetical protein